jgi:hypothetical protein
LKASVRVRVGFRVGVGSGSGVGVVSADGDGRKFGLGDGLTKPGVGVGFSGKGLKRSKTPKSKSPKSKTPEPIAKSNGGRFICREREGAGARTSMPVASGVFDFPALSLRSPKCLSPILPVFVKILSN